MTESQSTAAQDTVREPASDAPTPARYDSHRPNRLYQAAAWVAIVAGVVFIVGAIFATGFVLGRHSGPDGWMGGPRHHGGMMMPRPPMGDRDDKGPGMMGPGMMGPGMMGPGMMGPGGAPEPGQRGPATTSPAPTTPPGR